MFTGETEAGKASVLCKIGFGRGKIGAGTLKAFMDVYFIAVHDFPCFNSGG